ncbi:VIR-like CYIR protein [Plasmodium cynomolgi strain B]|uniref:VIR-like CYIR protein n=1 Tax=Plasmodium cynomolgi (strain B) TaxID=1120755 RepID=K6V637_PLACD|nr:VIR-like CYIR protein [Plasmodium cynomolgi strain B]GAB64542.1 VIR-like CYIR protein [Plasmodium cynomolgi strain B]
MADTARVEAITKQLQQEYPFLVNTPVYDFDILKGRYDGDSYGKVCDDITAGSYAINYNKTQCIKFFSNLDAMLLKGALGDNNVFMKNITEWFSAEKRNFENVPQFMLSFNKNFEENIRKTVVENFAKFTKLDWNQRELEDILKLYYFKVNAEKIKSILLGDISTKEYGKMCKFVNECLDIYRKYKNTRCTDKLLNANSGSTICYELEPFAETYEKELYNASVPRHKGVVSLKNDPVNARVYCSVYEAQYGYNPLGVFFKNKLSTLSGNGKLMVAGLSITAGMVLFYFCARLVELFYMYKAEWCSVSICHVNSPVYCYFNPVLLQH